MKATRKKTVLEATTKDLGKWTPGKGLHGFALSTCTAGAESTHRKKKLNILSIL